MGILILLVAIAGVAGFFAYKAYKKKAMLKALSPEERAQLEADKQHQLETRKQQSDHNKAVKEAEKKLTHAKREHAKLVRKAEKELKHTEKIGHGVIGRYKGKNGAVSLTGFTISAPGGTWDLTDQTKARVDTAGNLATNSRSTLTRIATGGVLLGPVGALIGATAKKRTKEDARELYLLIEDPNFGALVQCDPNDGPKVRQLALQIEQTAREAAKLKEQRASSIQKCNKNLEIAEADTASIEQAERELEAVKASSDLPQIEQ